MQIVSNNAPKMTSKRADKLKGLLYLKGIQEHQITVAKNGADICCAYGEAIQKRMNEVDHNSFEYLKLRFDLLDVTKKSRDFISDFKEFKNQYETGTIQDIRETAEREQFEETEFYELNVMAQELIKYELYGKVLPEAENVEHPKVIKDIENHIELLKNLVDATKKELQNNKNLSDLEIAKLRKDLFDYSIFRQTLQKRLNKRKEYYYEQFLPVYTKDMEECSVNLDRYLEIAKQVIESGIDPAVQVLLNEYEKHKDEHENLWLFYTALRDRLKQIAQYVKRNPKKFPKIVSCLNELTN